MPIPAQSPAALPCTDRNAVATGRGKNILDLSFQSPTALKNSAPAVSASAGKILRFAILLLLGVVAALPAPDVQLDQSCPPIKYTHRSLQDGEVYFFFNESDETQTCFATLAGTGHVSVWDAETGKIQPLTESVVDAPGHVIVPLTLAGQEARFIVVGAEPPGAN
jgi:hypothetical protein